MKYIVGLFQGRINQKQFGIGLLFFLLGFAILAIALLVFVKDLLLVKILWTVFIIPLLYFLVSLYARRFHDMGHPGWWSIIAFLAGANLFVALFLLSAPGNKGANRFGEVSKGSFSQIFGFHSDPAKK